MSELNLKNRVRLKPNIYALSESNPIYADTGIEGTIIRKWGASGRVRVSWDNGTVNSYYAEDLNKIDKPIIDIDKLFEDIDI